MKSMVFFSAIATLLYLAQRSESRKLNDVIVRPDVYLKHPSPIKIALNTRDEARMKNFVQVPLGSRFHYKMKLYCYPNDPRFCVFYDLRGNIVGVQISFLEADVKNVEAEVCNNSTVKDYILTNFFGIPAYSFRIYFIQPDRLTEAGRQDTSEVAEGLWTTIDRRLFKIPRCQPNGPKIGTFDMQGCHPRLGTGFVNKLNPYSSCEEVFFTFALYDLNSLVGFGIFAPGYGSPGPLRDWYSHTTEESLKLLLPASPPCLEDLKKYNITAIIVFLIDNPRNITCPTCDCNT